MKDLATIIYNKQIANDVFEMALETHKMAYNALPGQFINISLMDASKLLKRPISISQINKSVITIAYKINGEGTKQLSKKKALERIEVLGPLGKPFPLVEGKKVLLIGGGIGVAPLLELAKRLANRNKVTICLAFRDKENTIYENDFSIYGNVFVTTDKGDYGFKGNAIDFLEKNDINFDIVYGCGPTPLLNALEKKYSDREGYLSYEARMACGVGLCHGCVKGENHLCVCTDGPVFRIGVIK